MPRILSAFTVVLVAAACSSSPPGKAGPASAEASLHAFLQAAADSNVMKMAEHWGTAKGSAASTGVPEDYPRRIAIMQLYLKDMSSMVLTNDPVSGVTGQRMLQVRLTRTNCTRTVPFTMVWTGNEWLVNSFNLEDVGNPSRPCTDT